MVTIIGFLDDLRDGWGSERLLVEDMLARAVAELGGQAARLRSQSEAASQRPMRPRLHPGRGACAVVAATLAWRYLHLNFGLVPDLELPGGTAALPAGCA